MWQRTPRRRVLRLALLAAYAAMLLAGAHVHVETPGTGPDCAVCAARHAPAVLAAAPRLPLPALAPAPVARAAVTPPSAAPVAASARGPPACP